MVRAVGHVEGGGVGGLVWSPNPCTPQATKHPLSALSFATSGFDSEPLALVSCHFVVWAWGLDSMLLTRVGTRSEICCSHIVSVEDGSWLVWTTASCCIWGLWGRLIQMRKTSPKKKCLDPLLFAALFSGALLGLSAMVALPWVWSRLSKPHFWDDLAEQVHIYGGVWGWERALVDVRRYDAHNLSFSVFWYHRWFTHTRIVNCAFHWVWDFEHGLSLN